MTKAKAAERTAKADAKKKEEEAVWIASQARREAGERAVPAYWQNQSPDDNAVGCIARVPCADLCIGTELAQEMMTNAILPTHASGCGGFGSPPDLRNLCVTRLERVENVTLWLDYQRQKAALRERLRHHGHAPAQLLERLAQQSHPFIAGGGERVLSAGMSEFWLWHGTKPDIADILVTSGFDERVGGESNGGLYGKGCYFADAACKANQYAQEVNADGEHCVIYCRVTMGSAYRTTRAHMGERRPPDNPATPGAPFDSIFAETGVAHGGQQQHNEFVVFKGAQVYPEFVVWYTSE